MKTLSTFIFIVFATLFAPVSNSAGSYPYPNTCTTASSTYGRPAVWKNAGVDSYRYGCSDDASRLAENTGCYLRNASACSGAAGRYRYSYLENPVSYDCQANSTFNSSTGKCHANQGYTAQEDVNGNWQVVPKAQCNPDQFHIEHSNTCSYFPCSGDTPYTFVDNNGVVSCSAPPESVGCYEGDEAWISLNTSAGANLPDTVTANGCEYRRFTCSDAIARGETCDATNEANLSKAGCVTDSNGTVCGGHYVGTGTGSYSGGTPSSGGSPQPPFEGTPSGGDGGDGGDGGSGEPDICLTDPNAPECQEPPPDCETEPENPECEGEGEDDTPWSPVTGQGAFDEGIHAEVENKKGELEALINQIKSESSALFSVDLGVAAELSCPSVDLGVFGNFELCLSDHAETFQQIGLAVLAIASFVSLFVVFM